MWSIILLSVGVFISVINFYLSYLRYPLHVIRGGGKDDYKWVSGFPLAGTLFIVLALVLDGLERPIILYVGLFALLIDTGGVIWLIGQGVYLRVSGYK